MSCGIGLHGIARANHDHFGGKSNCLADAAQIMGCVRLSVPWR